MAEMKLLGMFAAYDQAVTAATRESLDQQGADQGALQLAVAE